MTTGAALFASSRFRVESETLLPLLLEGGAMLRDGRDGVTGIRRKADRSLVTDLDQRGARFWDDHLEKCFPGDGVLNEETHATRVAPSWRRAARCWMVDPLDSTSSFVQGGNHYGILLGLTLDGVPRMGMAFRPATRELFWAAAGEGAWSGLAVGDRAPESWLQLRVSTRPEPRLVVSRGRRNAALEALLQRLGDPPAESMDGSIKICEVARGAYDAFVAPPENQISLWDLCGPQVVLQEAGGVLTGLDGKAFDFRAASTVVEKGILAAAPAFHSRMLERLRASPPEI